MHQYVVEVQQLISLIVACHEVKGATPRGLSVRVRKQSCSCGYSSQSVSQRFEATPSGKRPRSIAERIKLDKYTWFQILY